MLIYLLSNLITGVPLSSAGQQQSLDLRHTSSLYSDMLNNAINSGLRSGTPEVLNYLSFVNPSGMCFLMFVSNFFSKRNI